MAPKKRSEEERFWSYVPTGLELGDCWEWLGGCTKFGHGGFMREDQSSTSAHRMMWILKWGEPGPLVVRHKCDNPPCVNPNHLELGTHADNAQDRVKRGRNGPCGRRVQESCKRGHNNWKFATDGRRRCLSCIALRSAARYRGIPTQGME